MSTSISAIRECVVDFGHIRESVEGVTGLTLAQMRWVLQVDGRKGSARITISVPGGQGVKAAKILEIVLGSWETKPAVPIAVQERLGAFFFKD